MWIRVDGGSEERKRVEDSCYSIVFHRTSKVSSVNNYINISIFSSTKIRARFQVCRFSFIGYNMDITSLRLRFGEY